MKFACLGPKGTFTEEAAYHYDKDCEIVFYPTILEVRNAVIKGDVDEGIVPIENSIEGFINATLDALIFDIDCEIFIKKQIVMPIRQNFMVKPSSIGKEITAIYSHPQSLAQTRVFLNKNYNGVDLIECSSNAEAARLVSTSDQNIAAIGPTNSAEVYGLIIQNKNIQSSSNNKTSFVVITKDDTSKPKVQNITTIAFSTENKPGALYKLLGIFSLWDLNITTIVSRPMKEKHREYVFLIDIEDYTDETDLESALTMVKRKTNFYKNLGTYSVLNL